MLFDSALPMSAASELSSSASAPPHTAQFPIAECPPAQQMAIAAALRNPKSLPTTWLEPETVAGLQDIITDAHQKQQALLPCGQGTKLDWGGLGEPVQAVVSSRRLNRIVEHAQADLTLTVEAGAKLQDVQAELQLHQQFLPLDPLYQENATVGGVMATGVAGSWQQRFGGVRDLILGFSFVRADGKLAKAGGRVVKNVAGYDLMKLFTGSYGTLGYISQITFRLYPWPPASQTLSLTGSPEQLTPALQAIRRSGLSPTAVECLSPLLTQQLSLSSDDHHLACLIRLQNQPKVVQDFATQIVNLVQPLKIEVKTLEDESETDLWQRLQHTMTAPFTESAGLCKIGVLPGQIVNFLQQAPGLAQLQLGTGNGFFRAAALTQDCVNQQRIICQNYQGYLTLLTAPMTLKAGVDAWGYGGNGLDLMQRLKQQFDPHRLLSPGRFVGGI